MPITDELIVVSNRQPYRHRFTDNNPDREVTVDQPTGGLVAGLDPVLQSLGGTWIAWGDGDADRFTANTDGIVKVPPNEQSYSLQRVFLDEDVVEGYYTGYANQTLWPLCHTMMGNFEFSEEAWKCYRTVNEEFARATAAHASEKTIVWFQDYHLILAPKMIREEVDSFLMHFWHIPWPPADVFHVCPYGQELIEGLLANDLLGFHTDRYCENFLATVNTYYNDATVDFDNQVIFADGSLTSIKAFPLGIDVGNVTYYAGQASHRPQTIRDQYGIDPEQQLLLGVDRLDYTKGIPERLAALEYLWDTTPSLQGECTYVQKATESRSSVPAYQRLQTEVTTEIERINQRFGTDSWQPIILITEYISQGDLCALYQTADVSLVTPLRDGMNLVAHEYIAAQIENSGALVLSEFAGAHELFGEHVFSINPYNTNETAATIKQALNSKPGERKTRMQKLRKYVAAHNINQWIVDILDSVDDVRQLHKVEPQESIQ